jgi:hypothetical protein
MVFDPLVDAALIGFLGVVAGIFGYAFQNWQIKKKERERAEYVAKREKYEEWIKTFVDGFFQRTTTGKPISNDLVLTMNEANNMLMLYGSDNVVKAVVNLWKTWSQREPEGVRTLIQEIILAMRKDLVSTDLTVTDVEFLRVK